MVTTVDSEKVCQMASVGEVQKSEKKWSTGEYWAIGETEGERTDTDVGSLGAEYGDGKGWKALREGHVDFSKSCCKKRVSGHASKTEMEGREGFSWAKVIFKRNSVSRREPVLEETKCIRMEKCDSKALGWRTQIWYPAKVTCERIRWSKTAISWGLLQDPEMGSSAWLWMVTTVLGTNHSNRALVGSGEQRSEKKWSTGEIGKAVDLLGVAGIWDVSFKGDALLVEERGSREIIVSRTNSQCWYGLAFFTFGFTWKDVNALLFVSAMKEWPNDSL
jgi:hypothetical protein